MAAGWSELHGYLLGLILEKLDLVAHARFASVCSSWRSVAVENPPINKPLYMALSHEPEHLLRRFIASFIPSWKEARFIGALDGWVVVLIDGRDLFLLNKGFNSIIPLPPLPEHLINLRSPSKVVLSSSPPLSSSSSSGECTVVFMQFCLGVYYSRLGSDESFTKILSVPQWVDDILFYNGRLYVLYFPDTVVIFDRLLNMVSLSSLAHLAGNPNPRRFLVSGNNVLYIIVGLPSLYFVLTLEGSEVPVNTIGEDDNFQILLSNRRCSLSITTKEHKEFRRETNYFEGDDSTFVLDTSKDPNKAKAGDPWPLFFIMFSTHGIENLAWEVIRPSLMRREQRHESPTPLSPTIDIVAEGGGTL